MGSMHFSGEWRSAWLMSEVWRAVVVLVGLRLSCTAAAQSKSAAGAKLANRSANSQALRQGMTLNFTATQLSDFAI